MRRRLVYIFGGLAIIIGFVGYCPKGYIIYIPWLTDFYLDIRAELIGIGLTVILIDRVYEIIRRDEEIKQEKKRLIVQMGSPDNSFAIEAVRQLRDRGWLTDGTLQEAYLHRANLNGANLENAVMPGAYMANAKLKGANLSNSNLKDVVLRKAVLVRANFSNTILTNTDLTKAKLQKAKGLTEEQLAEAKTLLRARMVSGKRYNGRFNYFADTSVIQLSMPGCSVEDIASFYGVCKEDYLWGQKWNHYFHNPPIMHTSDFAHGTTVLINPDGKPDDMEI